MHKPYKNRDVIKRKLREIKKIEIKIRSNSRELIWNKFFDLKDLSNRNAKYTIEKLSLMTKDEFSDVIDEYFYHVYYWYYKERGIGDNSFLDIDILTELGLPMDSTYDDVIRTFRERVKTYHPDNGGDVDKFLEIMESFNKFRVDT